MLVGHVQLGQVQCGGHRQGEATFEWRSVPARALPDKRRNDVESPKIF